MEVQAKHLYQLGVSSTDLFASLLQNSYGIIDIVPFVIDWGATNHIMVGLGIVEESLILESKDLTLETHLHDEKEDLHNEEIRCKTKSSSEEADLDQQYQVFVVFVQVKAVEGKDVNRGLFAQQQENTNPDGLPDIVRKFNWMHLLRFWHLTYKKQFILILSSNPFIILKP